MRKPKPKTKAKGRRQLMAIYHCSISNSKCANASDAYIEGEKRKDKEKGAYYDYSRREDVVYKKTLLADEAPQEWKDSEKLWEAVALAEKPGGRQAKKIEVSLPQEWKLEEQIQACDDFAEEFRKKGHCITYAIHNKNDGNPHAHFLLTLRQVKDGKFKETKSKKMKCLDENGKPIPLIDPKTGEQKVRVRQGKGIEKLWKTYKVEDMPCSSKKWLRDVRLNWQELLNKRLPEHKQVSCLTLKEQGIEREPTKHEGYGEKAEERKEYNLLIRAYNEVKEAIKASYKELKQILLGEEKEDDRREGSGTITENKQLGAGEQQIDAGKRRAELDNLVAKLHNQFLQDANAKLDGFAGKGEEAEGLGKQAEQASRGTEQTRGQTERQGKEPEKPRKGRSR